LQMQRNVSPRRRTERSLRTGFARPKIYFRSSRERPVRRKHLQC
jgi:hypothetical protein